MMKTCLILFVIASFIQLSQEYYITFGEVEQCKEKLKKSYTTQDDEYSKEIKNKCYENKIITQSVQMSLTNSTSRYSYEKFYSKSFDFSQIQHPTFLKEFYEKDPWITPMKEDLKIQFTNYMNSYEDIYDSYIQEKYSIPKDEAKILEKQLQVLEKLQELRPIHYDIFKSQVLSYDEQEQFLVIKYVCDKVISEKFKEKFDQNSNCFHGTLPQKYIELVKQDQDIVIDSLVKDIQKDLQMIERKPFIGDKTTSSKIISLGFMLVYFILIAFI